MYEVVVEGKRRVTVASVVQEAEGRVAKLLETRLAGRRGCVGTCRRGGARGRRRRRERRSGEGDQRREPDNPR